ncbi:hypothetical protein PR202_ga06353 [Eleusine coracana subsp. coracana]|uniref:Pentatricopeptide repeat-containing protein n=1 Tax=Eleusine coracana subsp. coracana TaxID=191504 RepID=A0AAV5BUM1_ELECO|nr:hypothetical protein PR202_ga06353 [Eleusine coracana subsp. coracana]
MLRTFQNLPHLRPRRLRPASLLLTFVYTPAPRRRYDIIEPRHHRSDGHTPSMSTSAPAGWACARRLFDEMPERNVFTWNSMVSSGLSRNRMLADARKVFDAMPFRNSVSWAARF